jgi:hypothetical protein
MQHGQDGGSGDVAQLTVALEKKDQELSALKLQLSAVLEK